MKKRPDITARTRHNFLDAWWQCLDQKEGHVTVRDIAAAAGYHRSTFYEYFDSIEDLRASADEALLDELEDIVQQVIHDGAGLSTLKSALSRIFETYAYPLRVRFRQPHTESFARRLRAILIPLAVSCTQPSAPKADIELLCELVTADMIAAMRFLAEHPDISSKEVLSILHQYIHGGAPEIEKLAWSRMKL